VTGYSYVANSPLVSQITFQNAGSTKMTTTKAYDYLDRLTQISSTPSGSQCITLNVQGKEKRFARESR